MLLIILAILLVCVSLYLVATLITQKADRDHPAIGQFIEVANRKVHYLELNATSQKRPLVFIHGASCHAKDMAYAFTKYCNAHRAIFVDRPGCGHTDRKQGDNLAAQANMVAGLIEALELEKPIIVAQSYGTSVALQLALDHSEAISGLVLLAPVSHQWPGGVAWYNHVGTMPVIGKIFRHSLIPLYGHFVGRQVVAQAFWPNEMPKGYYDDTSVSLIFRPTAFKSNCEDIKALYGEITELQDRYAELSMPVRMVAGSHDTSVLSTIHAFSLRKAITKADLRYVENIGHPLHHHAAEEIFEEIEKMLSEFEKDKR